MTWQPWWTPCGSFRRWFVAWLDAAPWRVAPKHDRCYMGAPVQDSVACKRSAPDGLWCRHHEKQLARSAPGPLSDTGEAR